MNTKQLSDQKWLDHCAEMARLHDEKAAELRQAGWKQSGSKRAQGAPARFTRNGETVELRRQLGSATWYMVNV